MFGSSNSGAIVAGTVDGAYIAQSGVRSSSRMETTQANHLIFYNPNGVAGSIKTENTSTIFSTSSDYRLKENITPLTNAAERVKELKPAALTSKQMKIKLLMAS